jgi:carbamoyl-phosphate synthase large subunit
VQYGGQTPLKLCRALEEAGAPIIGTTPDAIDIAEDRERFQTWSKQARPAPAANATARTEDQAVRSRAEVGFPLVVRPSYVLGGRAMEVVYNEEDLRNYMRDAVRVSNDSPVLLDRFLDQAIEVDVDAICDGTDVLIGGIMEHVEQAGVHSGDSVARCRRTACRASSRTNCAPRPASWLSGSTSSGLMNVQFAIQNGVGVRARGQPARVAYRAVRVEGDRRAARQDRRAVMAGRKLADMGATVERIPRTSR